jgi:phosphoribosylanthranilate isomerase
MTDGTRVVGAFDGAVVARHGAPHVKFCGITREEDAAEAGRLGVSAIGMVLWAGSPRGIVVSRAREIARAVPPGVLRVGVFVNALPDVVRRASAEIPLDVVQLHGDEPIEWLDFFTRPVIKAVTSTDETVEPWVQAPPNRVTLLVDAPDTRRRGGTGCAADWPSARDLSRRRPTVLAGGLEPGNVARAIAEVAPYAVDVASGVESAPGIKDHVKMRAFIEAVRRAVTTGTV